MYSITKSGIGNNKLQDTFKKQIAKAFPNGGTTLLKSETEAARLMSAKIRNEIKGHDSDEKTGARYSYNIWPVDYKMQYEIPIKPINRLSVYLSQDINLADKNMRLKYDCNYRNYHSLAQSLNYDDSDKKFHFLHQKLYPGMSKMSCNLDNTRSEVYIDPLEQHCNIYYQNDSDYIYYVDKIPTPVLKTENGVSKTIYKKSQDDMKQVDLKNILFESLKNETLKLEERKNDEELRFENICCRGDGEKVFSGKLDKLVEKAYWGLHLQNGEHEDVRRLNNNNSIEVRNLGLGFDNGERMYVTKLVEDASIFNITLYNEKNEVTLDGEFYCFKDRNCNVLKFDSIRRQVNSDDEKNYNNPNNILDYGWKGSIYGLRKFMGQKYVKQGRENLEAIETIEKQYEAISMFQSCKKEVFDIPVEIATKAYEDPESDRNQFLNQIYIPELKCFYSLNKRNDKTYRIAAYNEYREQTMLGYFTILKDDQNKPLKENKEGKIFKFGEPGYDNKDNKLCFNISLEILNPNTRDKIYVFTRDIVNSGEKKVHSLSIEQFGENNKLLKSAEATVNKYSEDWPKGRLLKMAFETSKKDLKEIKADFEHNMLCPQDLNLIKITNKNAASLLAKNKKEILDFPTEIATTAYKYVKQHPDRFQDKNKYQRIHLADGKFIDVRKHEVYNKNQSHYEIILYNRDSKKTMKGLFLFSNGEYLLKENKEGKIFKFGEPGYNNQDNKLCFPMGYEVLTPDTGKKTFEFMRDIRNSGGRMVHRISMQQFDGNDNFVSGTTQAAGIKLEQILPNPEA